MMTFASPLLTRTAIAFTFFFLAVYALRFSMRASFMA